ncbi:MAG: hypothetical protein LBE08_00740, partial [Bifidobacteriaceae bacterium]|nr:hypothetical protein [Bifidobacteriaceae bacterium]
MSVLLLRRPFLPYRLPDAAPTVAFVDRPDWACTVGFVDRLDLARIVGSVDGQYWARTVGFVDRLDLACTVRFFAARRAGLDAAGDAAGGGDGIGRQLRDARPIALPDRGAGH